LLPPLTSSLFPYTTLFRSGWHAPADVFSGRALFGSRRPFVIASSAASALWRTLRIEAPNVEACVSVLEEIARESTAPKERGVLADRKSTRLNSSHLGISYA